MTDRLCRPCLDLMHQNLRILRVVNRASTRASVAEIVGTSTRQFHQSTARRDGNNPPPRGPSVTELFGRVTSKFLSKTTVQPYQIFSAAQTIYKTCSTPAAYKISEDLRKAEEVPQTEDGEEIGVGGGIWHDNFDLLPTFSTWSQVTMLHLYLIVVRMRCLEKEDWMLWQKQLVSHFFTEAEEIMVDNHGLPRAIRARYLKALWETWRGVVMSYDEGLVKGDAVMAAAVWRNIFKSREDVDIRHVAAIVSWMRFMLRTLDQTLDPPLLYHGINPFKTPPTSQLKLVDEPTWFEGVEGAASTEYKLRKPITIKSTATTRRFR